MVLAFGDHRLDIARRELRRGVKVIELEPKVFDLLTFLVLNRDRVVTKDDLLQGVWGGRIVSESALTTRITPAARDQYQARSQRAVRDNSEGSLRRGALPITPIRGCYRRGATADPPGARSSAVLSLACRCTGSARPNGGGQGRAGEGHCDWTSLF